MRKSLLKLVAAKDAAKAALVAEKNPKKRVALADAFAVTCSELTEAKSEKTVTHKEHTVDDGEGEGGDDDDEDGPDGDEPDDDDDEEEEEEEEEETEEEEEEEEAEEETKAKKAKAIASARTVLSEAKKSKKPKLIAAARASLADAKAAFAEAISAPSLSARVAKVATQHSAKVGKRVARLETQLAASKVDRMLERAKVAGKVTPAEVPSLKEIGMSSRKQLRNLLDARAEGSVARTAPRRAGMPSVEGQRQAMGTNLRGSLADQDKETIEMVTEAAEAMAIDPDKLFESMRKRPGVSKEGKAVLS